MGTPAKPKPLEIPVTSAHILQGRRQDARNCPVAIAVSEATGCPALVKPALISVRLGNGCWADYHTTGDLRAAMESYDKGRRMNPCTLLMHGYGRETNPCAPQAESGVAEMVRGSRRREE